MEKENIKILIVEDEMILAMDLKNILQTNNYFVCSIAKSGNEAISLAYREKPDMILMDIMISGELNGIETAKRIKTNLDIPVIFITALNDDENFLNAKEVSKYGYIVKPYNETELKGTIEEAINRYRRELKSVS